VVLKTVSGRQEVFMLKSLVLTVSVAVPIVFALGQSPRSEETKKQYLFVQTANEGRLDGNVLTISGLSPTIVYFSDRPGRDVGFLTYPEFLGAWKRAANSFASDPPNASLTYRADGKPAVAVLELMEPSFSDGALSYKVRSLQGKTPGRFAPVSLFIDSGGLMQLVAYGAQN
jgi:hypothetical protein